MQQEKTSSDNSSPISGHTVLLEGLTELAKLESDLTLQQKNIKQKEDSSTLIDAELEDSLYLSMDAANHLNKLIVQGCISTDSSYEMAKNVEKAGVELYPDAWRSAFPDGLPSLDTLAASAEEKRNKVAEEREQARLEALKPITVNVSGRMEYPEDDALYGTYTIQTTLQLTKSDTITDAANAVAAALKNNDWNIRDPKLDYYDSDMGRDMGPVSFTPNAVEIIDQDNVRVLAGHFKSGLTWETPATHKEVIQIQEQIQALNKQSSNERGWDNHETGRQLSAEAERLETKLTGTAYRENEEVLTVLQRQAKELQAANPEVAYSTEVSRVRLQKEGQAERLEKQLHEQITEHKSAIENLEDHRPGLLASGEKKDAWNKLLSSEINLLEKKEARLERVESLHHDMGLNGPKLEKLAVDRVRFNNPELASARDKSLQDKRTHSSQERSMRQAEKQSHGVRI